MSLSQVHLASTPLRASVVALMAKRKATPAWKVADKYFSLIVRLPDCCYICGSEAHLQCAHGWPRTYRTVRWDFRNAWCLCSACHVFYTHRPLQWDDWMRSELGEDGYAKLRADALEMAKPDVRAIASELAERWKSLEAAQ